jgi:hypothetical protein
MKNSILILVAFIAVLFNSCQNNNEIFTDFSDVNPNQLVTAADLGLKKFSVKSGKHDFTPNPLPVPQTVNRIGYYAMFNENTKYNFNDDDQFDYNKLTGGSFNFVNHLIDAFILGWRYNAKEDVFEVIDYWHHSGSRFIGADNKAIPVLKVKPNEVFTYWWELKGNEIVFSIKTQTGPVITRTMAYNTTGKVFKEIGAWFGGNRNAPSNLEVHILKVKSWTNNAPTL